MFSYLKFTCVFLCIELFAQTESPTSFDYFNPSYLSGSKLTVVFSKSTIYNAQFKIVSHQIGYARTLYKMPISICYNEYGYKLFKEKAISLSHSRQLNDFFTLGINATYHTVNSPKKENYSLISFDIGGQINHPKIYFDFFIENPLNAQHYLYEVESRLIIRTRKRWAETLKSLFDIAQPLNDAINFKHKINYSISEQLSISLFHGHNPDEIGFGIYISKGNILINSEIHKLTYSSNQSLSIIYYFNHD